MRKRHRPLRLARTGCDEIFHEQLKAVGNEGDRSCRSATHNAGKFKKFRSCWRRRMEQFMRAELGLLSDDRQ
jgi:hypothetical protein